MTECNSHRRTWIVECDRKTKPTKIILLFLLRSYSPFIVCCCLKLLILFQSLMFVGVMFLVKYKFFGHIHSVILNQSNEYSSSKTVFNLFFMQIESLPSGQYTLFSGELLSTISKPWTLFEHLKIRTKHCNYWFCWILAKGLQQLVNGSYRLEPKLNNII